MATRKICLALQGGGAHGAFTWDVLDGLLAEESLEIQAVSGTSAGAMDGAVLVDALKRGGRRHARERLEGFWRSISEAGGNVFKPGRMLSPLFVPNSDWSPIALWTEFLSLVWSPYDTPFYANLLADVLDRLNEITFNAALVQEIEAIDAIDELKAKGDAPRSPNKRIRLHEIKDEPALARLGHASKGNTEWTLLLELRDLGREAAQRWLKTGFKDVGREPTADMRRMLRCLEST